MASPLPSFTIGKFITFQSQNGKPNSEISGINQIEHPLAISSSEQQKYLVKTKHNTYVYVEENQLLASQGKKL